MFRAVQLSGPNHLISLGLTFNDVVSCQNKPMKTRHKKFPFKGHLCPIFEQNCHKSPYYSCPESTSNSQISTGDLIDPRFNLKLFDYKNNLCFSEF